MKRRTFLKSLGIGAAAMSAAPLLPRSARAAAERSFVFVYFRGGWDTLISLDPRDPNVFTEDRVGETRIEPAYDLLPAQFGRSLIQPSGSNIAFGPAIGNLAPHYDKMTVVRGLSMNTVTHDVGRRYFITGLEPQGRNAAGSAVPTRIAAQQGDLSAFPNLSVRVETYNDGDPSFASGLTVNSVADLITTLTDLPTAPPPEVRTHLDAYRARTAPCDPTRMDRQGFLGLLADSQAKARELVSSGLSSKFQFTNANDPEMASIATRYGVSNLNGVEAQAAMAYQAIRYELAQSVSIQLANSLDTHDGTWATDHAPELVTGFDALAQLVTDLAETPDAARGGNLLDHTTVMVFSEFGRTPMLNGLTGRDHSLTSSCILMGAGVPQNRVVGASSDVAMAPMAVDPVTGQVDDAGLVLTPTHVVASIMQSAGLDTTKLRTDGVPCLMA